jgi:predicted aspartyl protease
MQDMEILLGMSVLQHVEFSQRGDTLILRPHE